MSYTVFLTIREGTLAGRRLAASGAVFA